MADLSRGAYTNVIEHNLAAAVLASRPRENLGIAALAAAYAGDPDRARELGEQMLATAVSPTMRAFGSYVIGEVESVAGHRDRAEDHYARAIDLARTSGATFVVGVATVGLLTVLADTGRVHDALRGYLDVVDYFTRTGNWTHLWTSLRNLAQLLRRLGDHEPAALLAPPPTRPRTLPHSARPPTSRRRRTSPRPRRLPAGRASSRWRSRRSSRTSADHDRSDPPPPAMLRLSRTPGMPPWTWRRLHALGHRHSPPAGTNAATLRSSSFGPRSRSTARYGRGKTGKASPPSSIGVSTSPKSRAQSAVTVACISRARVQDACWSTWSVQAETARWSGDRSCRRGRRSGSCRARCRR